MKQYYVYILRCSDGSYYTGFTNNLERRLDQYNNGTNKSSFTFCRRPVELVFHTLFNDVNQAIAFEKQVKGWSRKKKEARMKDNWAELKNLAACSNESSSNYQ